ncbi:hypothetical protein GCM10023108_37200 [Saccharopolyspora hordei]
MDRHRRVRPVHFWLRRDPGPRQVLRDGRGAVVRVPTIRSHTQHRGRVVVGCPTVAHMTTAPHAPVPPGRAT